MSMKFRNVLGVVVVAVALGVSVGAPAGVIDKAADKLHDEKSDKKSDQKSDKKSDKKSDQAKDAPAPAARSRGVLGGVAPPPRDSGKDSRQENPGHDRGHGDSSPGPSHDLNDDLARLHGNNRNNDRDGNHDRGDDHDRGGIRGGGDRGGYDRRPPVIIERLPSGYRDYNWNGNRYYSYGGHWYRPNGTTYISIGVPFGLFVTTLPGYYTSFWWNDTRYFYSDHNYYVYEPEQRGYVVTHSPYGDDEDSDSTRGDDLYIYPARGQSEQQQADDRYQCHRWAADQSHFDPLNDSYDASKSAAYKRAMTACLTGRGYTVN